MSDRRDPAVEAVADALDRGLKRAQEAIDKAARRNANLLETMAKHSGEQWLSDLARHGSGPVLERATAEVFRSIRESKDARKAQRRLDREQRRLERDRIRAERRRVHAEQQTWVGGLVMLSAGIGMGAMAFLRHDLWWLIFPAFGLGMGGADALGSKLTARRALPAPADEDEEPPERAPDFDPRDARVDSVCAKILAELKQAPAGVKELVGSNEKSIEQLRATCRSLTQRERELRALINPDDDARLSRERDALQSRIASERDAVVRARLEGALQALEAQRKQRSELHTAAARFEAEHTRIAYTLENLYTQLLRLKSADSAGHDPASAALRQSLAQLTEEMDAVADAMEEVHREPSPISDVGSGEGRARSGERERS